MSSNHSIHELATTQKPAEVVFKELDKLFEPYMCWDDPVRQRGGHSRRGTPFHDGTKVGETSFTVYPPPTYHREQSFDEKRQLPWITQVMARLGGIAEGRYLPDVAGVGFDAGQLSQPRPFAERLAERITELTTSSVAEIIFETILEDLRFFVDRYPYLVPAFNAMLIVAGIDGVSSVIGETKATRSWDDSFVDIASGIAVHTPLARIKFFGVHGDMELACLGESYAQRVLDHIDMGVQIMGQGGKVIILSNGEKAFVLKDGTIIEREKLGRGTVGVRRRMEPFLQSFTHQARERLRI